MESTAKQNRLRGQDACFLCLRTVIECLDTACLQLIRPQPRLNRVGTDSIHHQAHRHFPPKTLEQIAAGEPAHGREIPNRGLQVTPSRFSVLMLRVRRFGFLASRYGEYCKKMCVPDPPDTKSCCRISECLEPGLSQPPTARVISGPEHQRVNSRIGDLRIFVCSPFLWIPLVADNTIRNE